MPANILLIENEASIADNVIYSLQSEVLNIEWVSQGPRDC